jgi:hypothetical protein
MMLSAYALHILLGLTYEGALHQQHIDLPANRGERRAPFM